MLRLILLAVLLLLVFVGGLAVALFHFYGWKGMVAFPFILLLLVWGGKFIIGKLIKRFALGLFSMKSSALRGATMTVHSITPVPKPPEVEEEEDKKEDEPSDEEEKEEEEEDEGEGEEEPKEYFAVDLTVTPEESSQGRVWEPGEFILTSAKIKSLEELEENELGTADQVLIWDGSKFGPDDDCKYPGVQRLKVTFAVKPGTAKAWLHYYAETIGSLDLPPWKPACANS